MRDRDPADTERKPLQGTRVAACLVCLPVALFALGGCYKTEEISLYTVPKPPPPVKANVAVRGMGSAAPALPAAVDGEGSAVPQQILGAIVPRGPQTWFFKLTGPATEVLGKVEPYLDFIRSLRFEGETPGWTLPEGWTQKPGDRFRHATIVLDGSERPLELTVSALPSAGDDFDDYLLQNINRWRGQLQAAPITREQLPRATLKQEIGDATVWLVNIEGPRADSSPQQPPLPFDYVLPEGWTRKPAGRMRLAEFEARDGERRATISVSTAGGELAANVNRWREQIGLPLLSAAELDDSLKKIPVGNLPGDYAVLFGPGDSDSSQSILGVIVPAQGQQWFFKLQGDTGLAKREQRPFEQFVHSIRFRGTEGESNDR